MFAIDACDMHYQDLNDSVKKLCLTDNSPIVLENVNGQRYIGNALQGNSKIIINGVPGNDLAVFMDGPSMVVNGNIQDAAANTMNSGLLVVNGNAGDTLGYGMRGGDVYISDNVGYRAGIHMKEYGEQIPSLVIGGTAGDFLGEYMAGGVIVVINLQNSEEPAGTYCGSGMHGGVIFIRGSIKNPCPSIKISQLEDEDIQLLNQYITQYQLHFNNGQPILHEEFIKLSPANLRPYHNHYIGI